MLRLGLRFVVMPGREECIQTVNYPELITMELGKKLIIWIAFQLPPKGLFQGNLQQISGVDPFGTACIPLDSYMLDLLSLRT